MKRREISRHPGTDDPVLAQMRRWFFARKPDAGFVLTDFPATLLQAKVLDEWLDARGECLSGVAAGPGAPGELADHYRGLGLLADAADLPALLGAGEVPPAR
ncbi:MAG TPA: adenylate kinase [Opitutaceae bacterium]|nr:adenylate kinase [Opitutaceae bacterium]